MRKALLIFFGLFGLITGSAALAHHSVLNYDGKTEIKAIKAGDPIIVVGWPDRFKKREIRGHQLHYPDGRVVMMRRGNYIWPKDILRLDRFVMKPETIEGQVRDIDATIPDIEQVLLWIEEGDHIARVAHEVIQGRPRLIGVEGDAGLEFTGVAKLLACHTQRDEFVMTIAAGDLDAERRSKLDAGAEYISEFNRVLSRWWEQERRSCE